MVRLSLPALVLCLILVTAAVQTWVGPSKTRGLYMGLGTLGGVAAGVAVAALISRWIMRDVSAVSACLGVFAGWAVAWFFARRVPRTASS